MAPRTIQHENPIYEYRIAAGLTQKALAAHAGISVATVYCLENEKISPVKKNGQLIKAAKRLCEYFEAEPQDLFALPRHTPYAFDILPYETWSERTADNCGEQFENRDFALFLIKNGMVDAKPKEIRIFLSVLFHNETFAAIASREGITRSRTAEIFSRAFRRIINAARKIGLPVMANTCGMTPKQRLG